MAIYHEKNDHQKGRVAAIILGHSSWGSFLRVSLILILARVLIHLFSA